MRVEMAVDPDFAAPGVAKGLGEEVKAAKAWLQGLSLPSSKEFVAEERLPAPEAPSGEASGDALAKDAVVAKEGDVSEKDAVVAQEGSSVDVSSPSVPCSSGPVR
jgi:hypothetical protein